MRVIYLISLYVVDVTVNPLGFYPLIHTGGLNSQH